MIKNSLFKFPYQYFHLNFDFESTGYFKQLDWLFLTSEIETLRIEWSVEVQALVMMDTHVHVLFRIPNQKENFFCEALVNKINKKLIASPDAYFIEPITSSSQYLNVYKYIYRNPVEAGISTRVEEYLFSSLNCLLGRDVLHLQVVDRAGLIQNPNHILHWLNSKSYYKASFLKDVFQANSRSI